MVHGKCVNHKGLFSEPMCVTVCTTEHTCRFQSHYGCVHIILNNVYKAITKCYGMLFCTNIHKHTTSVYIMEYELILFIDICANYVIEWDYKCSFVKYMNDDYLLMVVVGSWLVSDGKGYCVYFTKIGENDHINF